VVCVYVWAYGDRSSVLMLVCVRRREMMQAGGEAGAEVEQVERAGAEEFLVPLPVSAFSILFLEQGLVSL